MKPQTLDITGHRYGRLTVLKWHSSGRSVKWECLCDCGKTKIVQTNNLRSGHTRSCGCLLEDVKRLHSKTHGGTSSRTYHVWSTMRQRCGNPKHEHYHYYGGRGITVCERWGKFANFLEDMGHAPDRLQLDRTDRDGNYCQENCKWVTKTENMRNRSNNYVVEYEGEVICLSALAEKTGVPVYALARRIKQWGMSPKMAVEGAKNRRRCEKKEHNTK